MKPNIRFRTNREVLACNIGAMLAYIYSGREDQAAIFAREAAQTAYMMYPGLYYKESRRSQDENVDGKS